MIHVGITADLHKLLRTNYYGKPYYWAPIIAESSITARVILWYYFE